MAGLRGILAGLAISSAIIALPAHAQSRGSASLTHTVSVTVPPRVKIQVAALAVSTPASERVAKGQTSPEGLSLTINANRAWVLAIGSASEVATRKSRLQWSPDGNSGFSALTTLSGYRSGESVVLTVSAP